MRLIPLGTPTPELGQQTISAESPGSSFHFLRLISPPGLCLSGPFHFFICLHPLFICASRNTVIPLGPLTGPTIYPVRYNGVCEQDKLPRSVADTLSRRSSSGPARSVQAAFILSKLWFRAIALGLLPSLINRVSPKVQTLWGIPGKWRWGDLEELISWKKPFSCLVWPPEICFYVCRVAANASLARLSHTLISIEFKASPG